ncbi:MFS transporter [Phytoactinopolyspora limicola]|uniref:MFS transporter n=1 Tax=Phytoactinopolyspora limicola TaxID=2715536 RepID=UPI00140CE1E8|nr:MFS transporter [Phytoactinopolyspora limicola]
MSIAAPAKAGPREWIGLAVLALPAMLLTMDLTVLHFAVPHLSADLQPGASQLLWIIDVYGFLIAGFLITMGALGDRIGRRRLLLIGAVVFGAMSLLAAFSTSAEMLIVSRALLGIAGATLMPSTLSLIRSMFADEKQRGFALAVWMMSFIVGGALGPVVGGVLLEWFWWGSVFLLAVPVMALLLLAGPVLLPESRNPDAGRIDLLSVAQSLTAMLLMVYGLKEVAKDGLSASAAGALLLGLAIGVLFVRRQNRLENPLLYLALFSRKSFNAALGAQTFVLFAIGGVQLFFVQYLQLVLDLSPLRAGLWVLPTTAVNIVATMMAPAIASRVRPAWVISVGLAITTVGIGMLTQVDADSGVGLAVVAFAIVSAGFGPTMALGAGLVVGSAPVERAGAASAIQETGGELGMALGLAGLGSVGMAVYRNRIDELLPGGIPAEQADQARETLGAAVAAADQLPVTQAGPMVSAAQEAFIEGLHAVAFTSAGIVAVLAVAVGFFLRHVPPLSGDEHGGHDGGDEHELVAATTQVNEEK